MNNLFKLMRKLIAIVLCVSIFFEGTIPVSAKSALPQDYIIFCEDLIKVFEEKKEKSASDTREEIIYIMKECSDIYYREYKEVVSAEQMIKDAAIDKICGGNSVAVEAAKGVINSISNGDDAKDVLVAGVTAAIDEIPNAVQSEVMDAIFGSYLSIPLKILDAATTYVNAKNAKIGYVVAILENDIQVNISKLTVMVTKEKLTIDEIEEAYEIVNDIYNLMEDITSHVDGVDLPVNEWKALSWILSAEIRITKTADELIHTYSEYKSVDSEKLQAFIDSYGSQGKQKFEKKYTYILDNRSEYYQGLSNIGLDIVIREVDYAQMFEVNGLDNDALANILSPDKVNDENTIISVLHRYYSKCRNLLNKYNSWVYDFDCALNIENTMLNEMLELAKKNETLYTYALFIYNDYSCNGYMLESDNFRRIVSQHSDDYCIYRELYSKYIVNTISNLFYQFSEENRRYINDLHDWEVDVMQAGLYIDRNSDSTDCNEDIKKIISTYVYTIDYLTKNNIEFEGIDFKTWKDNVDGIGDVEIKAWYREPNDEVASGGPLVANCYINGEKAGKVYYNGYYVPVRIEIGNDAKVLRGVEYKKYKNLAVMEPVALGDNDALNTDYRKAEEALQFDNYNNKPKSISDFASVFR